MATLPDIPSHEHFISAVSATDDGLCLRLISDVYPCTESSAFALQAHKVQDSAEIIGFLARVRESEESVIVHWKDNALVVVTESGDERVILADSFSGSAETLNTAELSAALSRVCEWYRFENELNGRLYARLKAVQELLQEQMRRVQLKAASHEPESSVGVLYAQQLSLLGRLLREAQLKPNPSSSGREEA